VDCTRGSLYPGCKVSTVLIRLCLIKVAGRVTEMVTRIKIALPTAYPYQAGFVMLAAASPRCRREQQPLGETANPDHPRHGRHEKHATSRCRPADRNPWRLTNDPG